jgi:hypothetical protein
LNDADSAGVPEPGSRPRVGPFTPSGDAAAPGPDTHADLGAAGPPGGGTRTGWSILSGPVTGGRIFLAGFFGLLFSIGGLITIGIRRRRW